MDMKKIIIVLILILIGMFMADAIFGATIFEDDFNSYTDGDLNGQGSWTGSAYFDIDGTTTKEGAKAVYYTYADDLTIEKSGTGQADGTIFIYMRSAGTTEAINFGLKQSTTLKCAVRLSETGYCQRYVAGGAYASISAYVANTWYGLGIEWRSSDDTCRFTCDEGTTWSNWYAPSSGITTLDKVSLDVQTTGGTDIYFDYIDEAKYTAPSGTSTASSTSYITDASIYPFIFASFIFLYLIGFAVIKKI